ncbi:MAG: tetratricopeptide repeat protein [Candidatus Methanomethylophilaceae archaeon]|nr:tetratricopeptide repeat protein [Candidatus Methanomethylophilaceae archaeon]
MVQADHISVTHGNLTVDVPRRLFKGRECTLDEAAAEPFRRIVQARYPWVSDNSMDVLLKKARMEMIRVRDEETKGRDHSMNLASEGRLDEAIEHMKLHLELDPDDADSWYALGDLLCKAGRGMEGYKAYNRGRKCFRSCQKGEPPR